MGYSVTLDSIIQKTPRGWQSELNLGATVIILTRGFSNVGPIICKKVSTTFRSLALYHKTP
jgi:hypothetical protein